MSIAFVAASGALPGFLADIGAYSAPNAACEFLELFLALRYSGTESRIADTVRGGSFARRGCRRVTGTEGFQRTISATDESG
jgi:hypothetical protein